MERKVHGEIGARDASEVEAVLGDPGLKNDSSIEADGNESISLLQWRNYLRKKKKVEKTFYSPNLFIIVKLKLLIISNPCGIMKYTTP